MKISKTWYRRRIEFEHSAVEYINISSVMSELEISVAFYPVISHRSSVFFFCNVEFLSSPVPAARPVRTSCSSRKYDKKPCYTIILDRYFATMVVSDILDIWLIFNREVNPTNLVNASTQPGSSSVRNTTITSMKTVSILAGLKQRLLDKFQVTSDNFQKRTRRPNRPFADTGNETYLSSCHAMLLYCRRIFYSSNFVCNRQVASSAGCNSRSVRHHYPATDDTREQLASRRKQQLHGLTSS